MTHMMHVQSNCSFLALRSFAWMAKFVLESKGNNTVCCRPVYSSAFGALMQGKLRISHDLFPPLK